MILLAILISFGAGWNSGVNMAKIDLSKDGAYFCRVDEKGARRCYNTVIDPLATDMTYLKRRTN
jgi:hypothetical protein